MRSKSYFVLFSFCIALVTNLSAQSQTSLFQDFKSKTSLLDQFYKDIQQSDGTDHLKRMIRVQEVNLLKMELFSLKREIKRSDLQQHDQIYHFSSKNLDYNFELLDFYAYDYSIDYFRIVARLRCKTRIYSDFVKLEFSFYNNNSLVGEDYSYIDYESYGYSGMLPYNISFFETFTDKVDFDSISFRIYYDTKNGTGDILWNQIMELDSNRIVIGPYVNEWKGKVRNKSSYAVTFPKIFACILKNDSLISLDYTYLNLETQIVVPVIIYSVTISPIDSEQVTLKNEVNIIIDISGWTIGDKDNPIAYTFPQGTVLSSNEQKKISHNQLGFEIDDFEERIYLKDDQGITIDTWDGNFIIYSVTKSPTDSEQVTIKNCDIKNVDLSNWTIGDKNNPNAYKISQGTILLPKELMKFTHNQLGFQIDDAGEIIYLKDDQNNAVDIWEDNEATTGDVRIYSVTTTPTESEQVSLKNNDIRNVDISGWTIGDKNDPTHYHIPQNTILSPGEVKKFTHSQLGFGINDKDEIIYLKNQAGILIDIWYGPGLKLLAIYQEKFYPNSTATFNSYIDLPPDYDKIRYYLHYALYSLEGSGNITSNWPTFTQLRYSGQERTPIQLDVFLIDHDNDQIQVQIDWGDYSNLIWQGPFFSRSVPSLNHNYSWPGTYYINAKSKDSPNSETNWSDSLKVEILPIAELKITTQQLKAGTYKKLYRDTLKAEGGIPPYQWALSSGNLPNGLNLNSNNGEIFGIPSASGSCSFCIMVNDGGNPSVSDTAAFQIIINNNPPQLISANSINIHEHEELEYTARAIDPDGNALSYNFKNYPMWLNPEDSTISGEVLEGATDTCFTVIASDGELMDTLIVSVNVMLVNDPPKIISPDRVSAIEDSLFQYAAKATDPEGDKIIYIFKNYPNWLTPSDSIISGVPKEGTKDSSFIVIAHDGELSDSIRVAISVIPVNDPPELISTKIDTAYEDSLFTYAAKAIDPENDKINYSFINYPKWLTPSDSVIVGIPREGAEDTSITVIASDNCLSDTLSVILMVIPINDPPQIIHISDFAFENNETYSINLDTCVIDEDHDVESLTWKVVPSDANLNMNMTNHVVSFDAPNWTGTTEAKFIATDPEGASDSCMVNVTVELPSVVEDKENVIPKDFFLSQNYPNPFNPQTTIYFGIPKSSTVNITIYNLKGEIVKELFIGRKQAGSYFVVWDARNIPSGMYLIRFQAGDFIQIKKCLLLK